MSHMDSVKVPVSVLIAAKNEARNLGRCLEAIAGWADEIVVVDSQSTDDTVAIAKSYGANILQFHYAGGWPKKRQWALDTYDFRNPWILILDSDEILLDALKNEIAAELKHPSCEGYWLRFQIVFLGKQLRFGNTQLWKQALFARGKGKYEKRLADQDASMADIEVHEHLVVIGREGRFANPVRHENINTLDRYIQKHNEYSNWEAHVFLTNSETEIKPSLWGSQAQRRRWLKRTFLMIPGSPVAFFLYKYIFSFGFLDGAQGLIYALFQGMQFFHIKAKIFELRGKSNARLQHQSPPAPSLQPAAQPGTER